MTDCWVEIVFLSVRLVGTSQREIMTRFASMSGKARISRYFDFSRPLPHILRIRAPCGLMNVCMCSCLRTVPANAMAVLVWDPPYCWYVLTHAGLTRLGPSTRVSTTLLAMNTLPAWLLLGPDFG